VLPLALDARLVSLTLRLGLDIAERFQTLLDVGHATLRPIIVRNDPCDVLVGEGEHFWKQVVLVEILHVVDGGELLKVVLSDVLNLAKDPLILHETRPKLRKVVLATLESRRFVHDFEEVCIVLQRNCRPAHEEVCGDLRRDSLVGEEVDTRL